jgi:limonene-1,2-epoxide hydrolase
MTEQITTASTDTNIAVVRSFLFALRDKDLDAAGALLDDALLYENVGYTRIRGGRRTMKIFGGLRRPSTGFDVKFHSVAADGDTVHTERTDALMVGPLRANFWVCGVFEVRDGRITVWRDYIDIWDLTKGVLRGIAAVVVPAVQRTF